MAMTPEKFNQFEDDISTYLREIRYFNGFYEEVKGKDPKTSNSLYDETMKHANSALEIYKEMIKDRDLLEGHRNILEREKSELDKKVDELDKAREKQLVGV